MSDFPILPSRRTRHRILSVGQSGGLSPYLYSAYIFLPRFIPELSSPPTFRRSFSVLAGFGTAGAGLCVAGECCKRSPEGRSGTSRQYDTCLSGKCATLAKHSESKACGGERGCCLQRGSSKWIGARSGSIVHFLLPSAFPTGPHPPDGYVHFWLRPFVAPARRDLGVGCHGARLSCTVCTSLVESNGCSGESRSQAASEPWVTSCRR